MGKLYFWIDRSGKKGENDTWHASMEVPEDSPKPDYEMDRDTFFNTYNGLAQVVNGELKFGKSERMKKLETLYTESRTASDDKASTDNAILDALAKAYADEGAQLVIFKTDSKVKDEFYGLLQKRRDAMARIDELDADIEKVKAEKDVWPSVEEHKVKEK